jgi:hypothetical protein
MTAELDRRITQLPDAEPTEIKPFNVKPQPTPLTLYDALQIGYKRDENKQEQELNKYGYEVDKGLTNHDHLTAYNPDEKKLLYVVNGTQPTRPADILTDVNLALGRLKQTKRYQSDKRDYDKAKAKYENDKIVIAGHSLGGNIASKLDTGADIYTFNPASTFGEKINKREQAYRTNNDLVSLLKVGQVQQVNQTKFGLPILAPHELSNIKNQNLFI